MPPLSRSTDSCLPRVVTYYQTHHTPDGQVISILPLVTQPGVAVTHVILAAVHINDDPDKITLNDHHPSHPRFATLWAELRVLQASGVKVMAMLGGAARGSYQKLDGDQAAFDRYWAPVRDLIRQHDLDGIDLDVEEEMSINGIVRLVDRIRADFGKDFIISFAPVAAAMLSPRHNLSGFDYMELELRRGGEIDFYNAQFYNGWGNGASSAMYELMLQQGWPRRKIVIGLLTNPENGNGWVPWDALSAVLIGLRYRYSDFGGVMGWEYFNSLPAGRERPWEWARWMTTMLRPAGAAAGTAAPVNNGDAANVQKVMRRQEIDPDREDGKDAPVPNSFAYYSDGAEED